MSTDPTRIGERARKQPDLTFTSLYHHVTDRENLRACYDALDGDKAVGVDGVTKEQHGEDLEENLQGLADRLKRMGYRPRPRRRSYIPKPGSEKGIQPHERIFPICYEAARDMVAKAGRVAGIPLRPHELRRHAATYASRCGVPIEIVSKVILRHSNLSTTQRYLGKISDVEAMKWIESVWLARINHGKAY